MLAQLTAGGAWTRGAADLATAWEVVADTHGDRLAVQHGEIERDWSTFENRAARLAALTLADDQLIEELYLATLSRRPSVGEAALMRQAFEESSGNRREAAEDVLWTLLNTREFVYNQ